MTSTTSMPCPACGGAGGGPFGRAGSAWDDDSYVCPRCEGVGKVEVMPPSVGPGLAKGEAAARESSLEAARAKRKASA